MKNNSFTHWYLLRDELLSSLKKYWYFYLTFAVGILWLLLHALPAGKPYSVNAEVLRYSSVPGAAGGAVTMVVQFENGRTTMVNLDQSVKPGESIAIEVLPKYLVPDTYRIAN